MTLLLNRRRHRIYTCPTSPTFRGMGYPSCWHVICATCQQAVGVDDVDDDSATWWSHAGAVARLTAHLRDEHTAEVDS